MPSKSGPTYYDMILDTYEDQLGKLRGKGLTKALLANHLVKHPKFNSNTGPKNLNLTIRNTLVKLIKNDMLAVVDQKNKAIEFDPEHPKFAGSNRYRATDKMKNHFKAETKKANLIAQGKDPKTGKKKVPAGSAGAGGKKKVTKKPAATSAAAKKKAANQKKKVAKKAVSKSPTKLAKQAKSRVSKKKNAE